MKALSDFDSAILSYQRWQVPALDKSAKNDSNVLTEKQLHDLQQQARGKGFEIGKWEGLEAGKAEAEQRVRQLTQLLDAVAAPLARIDRQVAEELTQLAVTIARLLYQNELSSSPEAVLRMVQEALAALPQEAAGEPISIFMHPDDIALIAELADVERRNWRLIAKPDLERGGCQVSTPDSYIDGSVAARCQVLLAELLESGTDEHSA